MGLKNIIDDNNYSISYASKLDNNYFHLAGSTKYNFIKLIISAPISVTSSGVMPLTVPSVPTGIKIGVCILPCGVCRVPAREFPQFASTSN